MWEYCAHCLLSEDEDGVPRGSRGGRAEAGCARSLLSQASLPPLSDPAFCLGVAAAVARSLPGEPHTCKVKAGHSQSFAPLICQFLSSQRPLSESGGLQQPRRPILLLPNAPHLSIHPHSANIMTFVKGNWTKKSPLLWVQEDSFEKKKDGEKAQWLKHLLWKPENQHSDPQKPWKYCMDTADGL